tara:strand:+ start:2932 stop:3591 length:660 start_codon:yes stop_codon:yes gene_type:complete
MPFFLWINNSMTISGIQRQPTQLDYASPTQFKFSVVKIPKVEYFVTSVNIPGITLSSSVYPTRFKDIPQAGEKLTYESLSLSFLVDENLENYREIHGWLVGLGFPSKHQEFTDLLSVGQDRFPISQLSSSSGQDSGKSPKNPLQSQGPTLSDATLIVLTSKNNPVVEVRFKDLFPTSLTGLTYDQQQQDISYLTATVSFEYLNYEFATTNSSRTTVTTS